MEFINHYSMMLSALIIMGLTAYFLLRDGYKPKDGMILLGVAAVLFGGWLILRPQQASADGLAQLQAEFGQGRAVLLEMQSPFWLACAAAKPIVDGLETELSDTLKVTRVDVQSPFGRELAREYGVFTPTFVLFDAQGQELWRTIGSLDADKVRQSLVP